MQVAINGSGTMANVVQKLLAEEKIACFTVGSKGRWSNLEECINNEKIDVVIDFSHPNKLNELLKILKLNNLACVIATTGYTHEQLQQIKKAARYSAICQSYNTGIGINIVEQLLKQMNCLMLENMNVEILETHHNKKLDAPSGTAIKLYNAIELKNKQAVFNRSEQPIKKQNDIGITSLRLGNTYGEHSVFYGFGDEIIEIKHTALSKNVFASGAIKIAKYLINKPYGLYNIQQIIGE